MFLSGGNCLVVALAKMLVHCNGVILLGDCQLVLTVEVNPKRVRVGDPEGSGDTESGSCHSLVESADNGITMPRGEREGRTMKRKQRCEEM